MYFSKYDRTFNKFWKIGRIFGFYSHTYDGRHAEFHDTQIVSIFESGDSTGFDEILVNTDQTTNVTYIEIRLNAR